MNDNNTPVSGSKTEAASVVMNELEIGKYDASKVAQAREATNRERVSNYPWLEEGDLVFAA